MNSKGKTTDACGVLWGIKGLRDVKGHSLEPINHDRLRQQYVTYNVREYNANYKLSITG